MLPSRFSLSVLLVCYICLLLFSPFPYFNPLPIPLVPVDRPWKFQSILLWVSLHPSHLLHHPIRYFLLLLSMLYSPFLCPVLFIFPTVSLLPLPRTHSPSFPLSCVLVWASARLLYRETAGSWCSCQPWDMHTHSHRVKEDNESG